MSGVVLVTGPSSAGVTSMVGQLQARMPGREFAEPGESAGGLAPAAVVFVVSAVAPICESDCAYAGLVTAQTDTVVAVVSKIDDHRDWRTVLALSRDRLSGHADRFRSVPWVGAAAAPRLGAPVIGGLVELLGRRLRDPESARRNDLRASEFRLRTELARLDTAAGALRVQADALRDTREELSRQQVLLAAEANIALRSPLQHARVALTFDARRRCASARTELLQDVATAGRRAAVDVRDRVLRRCGEIVTEVDDEVTLRIGEVAAGLGLAEPSRTPPEPITALTAAPVTTGRLESRLMAVLGSGVGLGFALLVSRLVAGLAPRATGAGLVAGGLLGLAVTVWVVRSRGLLQHRAMLDRWVDEMIGIVRGVVEARVATRMLAAEAALSPAHLVSVAARRRAGRLRIAALDAELAEIARATTRAQADRDNEKPSLLKELRAVRDALADQDPMPASVTSR